MARLNEPPAPTETIESLKRKFMRQNRDIARANSTQSLRIRNLENETSSLLAENLGLREQLLRLQTELDDGRRQRVANHTEAVKSQLDAKLRELGALITSLGREPESEPIKKSPKISKLVRASPSHSPDQRNWKNTGTLSDGAAGQDGRLPPILENKSYPRRTLESRDLKRLSSDVTRDTTDSPEIGPPPVSQFIEDPVKIDLPNRNRSTENEDLSSLDPAMSINLEQRKKRKDSIAGPESRRTIRVDASPIRELTGALKAGAKRKLSIRDDEERDGNTKNLINPSDDFKFTRVGSEDSSRSKYSSQPDKTITKLSRDYATAKGGFISQEKTSSAVNLPARRALAPKSVNESPKKGSRASAVDDINSAKPGATKAPLPRDRPQNPKQESVLVELPVNPIAELVEIQAEPETPAGLDMFSPSSSNPSINRTSSRDTPPPMGLGQGSEAQRPSRRARGAVSYAEPSLRDKMRRPTNNLADAVGAKVNRTGIVKLEESVALIKSEQKMDDEDAWKSMPTATSLTLENSPLRGKVSVSDSPPIDITAHRKRRESILSTSVMETPRSTSGSAISTLFASSRESKGKTMDESCVPSEGLDIYEIREPSSESVPGNISLKSVEEEKPVSRFSRRHTSISKKVTVADDGESSDLEAPTRAGTIPSRRRQSTLGLSKLSAPITQLMKEEDAEKGSKNGTTATVEASRSDRVGTRRRSMMV